MSTPEEASDYLTRTNFKSIIEWLTAEAILNRPEDPMFFCKHLLDAKINERGGVPFSPEQPNEYVRTCYSEASNLADEHGRIHGKVVGPTNPSEGTAGGVPESMVQRMKTLERLIVASRSIADNMDPFDATNTIIKESCGILNADRASIFTMTNDKKDIVLMVAEGAKNITVPVGVGISGGVAASGEVVNIPDAYADDRFDSSFDAKTGYKTNNILCLPIMDSSDEIVGVLQLINKAEGPFTAEDEEIAHILASQAGIALKNAKTFRAQQLVQQKLRSVTDLVRAMQADMGINSLIFTLTGKAPRLVDADRCTIFLLDEKANALTAMQGEINVKVPLDKPSIASSVANTGELINIPEAYEDDRFGGHKFDKESGYRTRTILCLPIRAKQKVCGVIQLINKGEGVFDTDDEEMMTTFLDMAGPILMESTLMQGMSKDEATNELEGAGVGSRKAAAKQPTLGGFTEEEEEEEEEEDA